MARRDFISSVSDGLKLAAKDHVKSGFGSLRLNRKDKKTFARLFFKDGLVYGIEVSTYKPNIVTRIVTNEFISEANRTQVLNKFNKTLNDFNVVKFVVDYQLFPERPLATYIKDYFFDAFDDVYKWTEVSVEWKANDKLVGSGLTVNPTDLNDIVKRLEEREAILTNKLANAWAVHPKDFKTLPFVKNFEYNDPDYTKQLLLSLPEGATLTIGEVAEYFGLPYFNTEVDIFDLWQAGAVDILHPRGMQFSNRSEQQIRDSRNQRTASVSVQEDQIVAAENSAPIELVKDIVAEEETQFPPLIEESLTEEDIEIIVEETVSFTTDEEPAYSYGEADDVYEYDEAEEELEEPNTFDGETIFETPSTISDFDEEADDDQDYLYSSDEDTDFYIEEEPPTPQQTNNIPEEPEEMASTSAGLSAMAQQLKTLIFDIKKKIAAAKTQVAQHDSIIKEKTAQKKELIAQLRALDSELGVAKKEKEEAVATLEALETEFQEFTQLLS